MKMAKANENDFKAAYLIAHIVDEVVKNRFPPNEENDYPNTDPDFFDWDEESHIKALQTRLRAAMNKGSILRVIGCANCLLDPVNRIVDERLNYLDFHPTLKRVEQGAEGD